MSKINKLLIYISVLIPAAIMAQPGKDVPSQTQDVIKNFDAKLLVTERINVQPVLPAVDTSTKAQAYSVPNKILNVNYTAPSMRPIAIKTEKLPPQYKG